MLKLRELEIYQIQWCLVYPDTFVPEKNSGYMSFPYIGNMTYLHMFFMLNIEHVDIKQTIINKDIETTLCCL